MNTLHEKISITTLEGTPRRALELIRGIGASPEVMRALSRAGYTTTDHQEGIRLLNDVLSFVVKPSVIPQPSSPAFEAAVKEIKHWVKSDFRRIRVALYRFFPEQEAYLCTGLEVSSGMDEVALVEQFLKRVAALGGDVDRKATRKADHAAFAMMEQRGVTKASLKHLQGLVAETHATPEVPPAEVSPNEGRLPALVALRAWYEDWAETARTVLKRRDYLIRVGLATRKSRATATPVVVATAATVAAPSAPPPSLTPAPIRALPMNTSSAAA